MVVTIALVIGVMVVVCCGYKPGHAKIERERERENNREREREREKGGRERVALSLILSLSVFATFCFITLCVDVKRWGEKDGEEEEC